MNVLTADDHELFRSAVGALISREFPEAILFQAGSLDEALNVVADCEHLDLVLIDLDMPGMDGVESIEALMQAFPGAKHVVMSASETWNDVVQALAAGAVGYIPKSLPSIEIANALRHIVNGGVYALGAIRAQPTGAHPVRSRPHLESLTDRQQDVLMQLLEAKTSKQIARALNISESTVKIHLAAVYRALGVRTRAEAILAAGAFKKRA